MTDQRRLQDKLQKFAVPGKYGAGGRVLEAVDAGGFLAAVLHEIDETILARLLVFENDSGMVVKLDVANRRLLRLNQLSSDNRLAAHNGLLEQIFSDADSAGALALAALFGDFLQGAKTLHVWAMKLGRTPEVAEIGYSAQNLADALGIGLYGADPVQRLNTSEPFISYCQDIALAWVHVHADGKTEQSGRSDDLAPLSSLCDADNFARMKALDGLDRTASARRCIVLGHDPEDPAVICLETASDHLFCLIPGGQLAAVLSGWYDSQ